MPTAAAQAPAPLQFASASTTDMPSAESEAAAPEAPPPPPIVRSIMGLLGLTSAAADPGAGSANLPALLGAAWWVQRIENLFLNQAPTASYDPGTSEQHDDGTITGAITATDRNNDPLRYAVTRGPEHGTVTVDADGTFIYTPDANAPAAGSDTFTVAVSDNTTPHIHGLAGLFNPNSHRTPITVTLTWNNQNQAPILNPDFTPLISTPGADGVVIGSVNGAVTDPDGDTIIYSGSADTPKGTFVVDPNGGFIYTPTLGAQIAASADGASPADKQDSFTILADDGQGGTTSIVVVVPIISPYTVTTVSESAGLPYQLQFGSDGATYVSTSSVDNSIITVVTADGITRVYHLPGHRYGQVVFGADGTVYQVTEGTDPTTNSPVTTVTLISPDGTFQSHALDGVPSTGLTLGPDGSLIQITQVGKYTDTPETNILLISPNGDTHRQTLPGHYSSQLFSPNGTVYVSTTHNSMERIMAIAPDGTNYTHTVYQGLGTTYEVMGPEGSLYQTSFTWVGLGTEPTTTVAIITANGAVTHSMPGQAYGGAVFDADGTAYQTATTWESSAGVRSTELLILSADGTPSLYTFPDSAATIIAGPDDSMYLDATSGNFTDGYSSTLHLINSSGHTTQISSIDGDSSTYFGPSGTIYLYSYTDADSTTRVVTIKPDGTQVTHEIVGTTPPGLEPVQFNTYGTAFVTTISDGVDGGNIITVTTIDPDGNTTTTTTPTFDGTGDHYFRAIGFGSDGTAYSTLSSGAGVAGYTTFLTVIPADGSTSSHHEFTGTVRDEIIFSSNGTGYLLINTGNNLEDPVTIIKISDGEVTTEYVSPGYSTLTVGPEGTAYVSTFSGLEFTTQVAVISADGTTVHNISGLAAGLFMTNLGEVFIDAEGNGYLVTTDWNRQSQDFEDTQTFLTIFRPDGTTTTTTFTGGTKDSLQVGPDGNFYLLTITGNDTDGHTTQVHRITVPSSSATHVPPAPGSAPMTLL